VKGLSPPGVDHTGIRASALHWGMAAAEATGIMGTPSDVNAYISKDVNVRVLDFSDELIPTKLIIVNETVSGVALDVARIDDRSLPSFSQAAWLGMSRAAVSKVLGTAKGELRHHFFNVALDQLIFEPPGQPDLSVYLMDDRVVAKKVGRAVPDDILRVVLPSLHDQAAEEVNEQLVRIGMTATQVCVEQQRDQPPSNRAGCSGQENFHVNHSTWDLPCQNPGCDNKRSNKRSADLAQIGFIKSSAVAFLGAT